MNEIGRENWIIEDRAGRLYRDVPYIALNVISDLTVYARTCVDEKIKCNSGPGNDDKVRNSGVPRHCQIARHHAGALSRE